MYDGNTNRRLGTELGLDLTSSVWPICSGNISQWEYTCDTAKHHNVEVCDQFTNENINFQ